MRCLRAVGLRCLAPLISVMQPAELRLRHDFRHRRWSLLDCAAVRCITVERAVKTVGVVIGDIIRDEQTQVFFVEHDHVVQQ